jgi:CheY-like chemotaxis protein
VSALARSGEEAIKLTKKLDPDLVLMDVNLAGSMNGIEASQQIQELKPIPVVYLTAYPNVFVQNPNRMAEPGMCLSKPFSVPQLRALLNIVLGSSSDNPLDGNTKDGGTDSGRIM